ncbi:hypothetical protein LDENG_00228320, partial [Lucifuga dentata]
MMEVKVGEQVGVAVDRHFLQTGASTNTLSFLLNPKKLPHWRANFFWVRTECFTLVCH